MLRNNLDGMNLMNASDLLPVFKSRDSDLDCTTFGLFAIQSNIDALRVLPCRLRLARRATGRFPVGRWAGGPVGRWAGGPVGRWAGGPVGRWAGGPVGQWAGGPEASKKIMIYYFCWPLMLSIRIKNKIVYQGL